MIQSYKEYPKLMVEKYTLKELKENMKTFSYKSNKTRKKEIALDFYNYLRDTMYCIRIQHIWKKYLLKLFNHTQGPAIFKRTICNNVEDFLTTEPMKDIHYKYFISYRDKNDFIYGFNILSIGTLIEKKQCKNPYTMEALPEDFVECIQKRKVYNKHYKYETKETKKLSLNIDTKLGAIFQKLDDLGNYTQVEWVTKLNNKQLRKFVYELFDLWIYRANLPQATRMELCPPYGNPFRGIIEFHVLDNRHILVESKTLKQYIFMICDTMLNNPNTDVEKQSLCGIYILTALTLASKQAAIAMPWLYSSVM